MSEAPSPAPSAGERKKREVPYKFCPECSNLLYAREERATQSLVYLCKACRYQEDTEPTCVQRTELGSTAGATAGTTTDVANDPTVGDTLNEVPPFCTMCGGELECNRCGEATIGESEVFDQVEAADDPES